MSRYRSIAKAIARRAFCPEGGLAGSHGAELTLLIEELADDEDVDWILEDGHADHRKEKLRDALVWVLETYAARNMTAPLTQTNTVTFFRFTVYSEPTDPQEESDVRARLRLHDRMVKTLRSLDPDDFEALCGRVLTQLGCTAVHVTRSSRDLGADFFGRLPAADVATVTPLLPTRSRVLGNVYLLMFGQAKRYADINVINLDTIKLVEATWLDILRRKQDDVLPEHLAKGLEQIGWKSGDLVKYLFVTSSSYTSAAMEWASIAGMATLDGDQLAQLLLAEGIGVEFDDAAGAWRTDVARLTAACS